MLKTVRQTIRQYNMLAPGDGVVVGLSGGADSVSLLWALKNLRVEIKLFAVHVNHNLRGDASQADEAFVRRLCEEWNVPLLVYQADVSGLAASRKLGIEEAGRIIRYEYMYQSLDEFSAQKIAVGHNMDDNAETVLLNLFRGAGLKGLCGIPPVNGKIIRPLLEVRRDAVEAYAEKNKLQFITDGTNASLDYSRNCLRNEIIPVIRKHFGSSTSEIMARNALSLRADEEFLAAAAKDAISQGLIITGETISLPIEKLLTQPIAIACRIIREAIKNLRGELALENIQATHVKAVIDIAKGGSGREVSLPGLVARREYANLVLHKPLKTPSAGFCYSLSADIPVYINELNKTITITLKPPKHYTHAFNYDNVTKPLELRTRRPGDKITLTGGTKKLQDYFTDTKTPRIKRSQVPLLADGSNILWIMDKHNRINTAYRPIESQQICWVITNEKGQGNEQKGTD